MKNFQSLNFMNHFAIQSRKMNRKAFLISYWLCECFWLILPYSAGGSDDPDEDEEVGAPGGQAGGPGAPTSPNQPGKPNHKHTRLRRKRHKALTNKPQDFQVLSAVFVSVIKASQFGLLILRTLTSLSIQHAQWLGELTDQSKCNGKMNMARNHPKEWLVLSSASSFLTIMYRFEFGSLKAASCLETTSNLWWRWTHAETRTELE